MTVDSDARANQKYRWYGFDKIFPLDGIEYLVQYTKDYKKKEKEMLEDYGCKFKDPPPLNSNLPPRARSTNQNRTTR